MNTGTKSATPTASAVPLSAAMWPSASPPRSQPSQPPVWTRMRVPWTCRIDATRRAVSDSSFCSAVHRLITSLTGSVPARPNEPASRVVVKARIPQLSKSGTTSLATSLTLVAPIVNPCDRSAERVQPLVDALVTTLDLADIIDEARAVRTEGGQQHRHSGADVGGLEEGAAQSRGTVDERSMWIAEDDACAHGGKLVDEEKAGLEHLLVHEDEALALRRRYDCDRHRVRGERRPWLVFELRHVTAHVRLDLTGLFGRHDQVGPVLFALDTQSGKSKSRGAQVLDSGVLDPQLGLRDRRQPNERTDFDVVRADLVSYDFVAERPAAVNCHGVGTNAFDLRSECDKKVRKVLNVWLARRVPQHGSSGGGRRRHESIFRRCYARLVEEDVGAPKSADVHLDHLAVSEMGAQLLERKEMGIESSSADHIPAGRRKCDLSASRKERRREQDRRADLGAKSRIQVCWTELFGVNVERILTHPLHRRANGANELDEGLDVADPRDVFEVNGVVREQRRGNDRQRGVLVSGGTNGAAEGFAALDDELYGWHG